jgi:hypothetical protein
MSSRDADTRHPGPLRRRDFLALGSLAALTQVMPAIFERAAGATALAGAAAVPAPERRPAPQPTLPLSVGYLDGSELLDNLSKLAPDLTDLTIARRGNVFAAGRRMLPAHRYPSGDPRLVGGAVRMTIHDLYPRTLPAGDAGGGRPVALDLDVLVPLLDPPRGSTARFLAWSYRRLPAEDRSARVSFVLWPDWYSDLSLILRVVPPGVNSQPRLLQARFTLGADPGRPRLLKGIYLLGLDRGTWEEEADLPDDPAQVPAELTSVLVTVEPEELGRRPSHR